MCPLVIHRPSKALYIPCRQYTTVTTHADKQTDRRTNLDPWHIQQMNRRITDTNVIAMMIAAATMIINSISSSPPELASVVVSITVGDSVAIG